MVGRPVLNWQEERNISSATTKLSTICAFKMLASRSSPRVFHKNEEDSAIWKEDKVVVTGISTRRNYYTAQEVFNQLKPGLLMPVDVSHFDVTSEQHNVFCLPFFQFRVWRTSQRMEERFAIGQFHFSQTGKKKVSNKACLTKWNHRKRTSIFLVDQGQGRLRLKGLDYWRHDYVRS